MQLLEDLSATCVTITVLLITRRKVLKDNESCIGVAESKNYPARLKHVVIKCHSFRGLVNKAAIRINHADAKKKLVDASRKPVEANQFFKLTRMLMGW